MYTFSLTVLFSMHFDAFDFYFICTYSIVLIAIVIVLAIPIFGLTGFHMVLVSRGRTTNEQVTGKFKGGYNPFSRGCWHNCCYTQFGPQYPRSVFVLCVWVRACVRAALGWQYLIINLCADSFGHIVFRFELCSHNLLSIQTVWWNRKSTLRVEQRRKIKRLARLRMKSNGMPVIMRFSIQICMKSINRHKWKRTPIMVMATVSGPAEQLTTAK